MAISDLAIGLTEAIACYMKAAFVQKMKDGQDGVPIPPDWDFTLVHECDQAVSILLEAYHNACMKVYL